MITIYLAHLAFIVLVVFVALPMIGAIVDDGGYFSNILTGVLVVAAIIAVIALLAVISYFGLVLFDFYFPDAIDMSGETP